jgi:hypothetical protein
MLHITGIEFRSLLGIHDGHHLLLLYLTQLHIKEKLSPFHETEIFIKFNFVIT